MGIKKILWLDDLYEDFDAYISTLFRSGYLVDTVKSVSEALEKLSHENYTAVIFDITALPGDDEEWIEIDKVKRKENPYFDSYLGLEMLYSLFKPGEAKVKFARPITIDPETFITFSVVYDKFEEISTMGIPAEQIVYKSVSDLTTLPNLVEKIQDKSEKI